MPFEEKNVAADRKLVKELLERSGQMRVPTIIVGQEVMVGFDEKALEKALQALAK